MPKCHVPPLEIVSSAQVSFTDIVFFWQGRDSPRDVKLAMDTVASALRSCYDQSFKTEEWGERPRLEMESGSTACGSCVILITFTHKSGPFLPYRAIPYCPNTTEA